VPPDIPADVHGMLILCARHAAEESEHPRRHCGHRGASGEFNQSKPGVKHPRLHDKVAKTKGGCFICKVA
jgi:hypothetical protein